MAFSYHVAFRIKVTVLRVTYFYKVQKITAKLLEWESQLYLHLSLSATLDKTESLVCYIQIIARFASFSVGRVEKICSLWMLSLCFCCLCRSDGGLPKRVACDFRESSVTAWALPVHPEAHLRLCRGVLATAASRGQRNWSGCNLLSRYSCLQTNWFTCLPAVCIRPSAFEVKVCCGVSSSALLKEQKVEMPFLE